MPKSKSSASPSGKAPRSLSARIERSLKETDRLLRETPDSPPSERAKIHLDQAKALALLELAEAIRQGRRR